MHPNSLRNLVKELTGWISQYYQLYRIERKNPVIVYQMGKVGSSSVVSTLRQSKMRRPIIQVHTLNEEILKNAVKKHRDLHGSHLPLHLITSSILVKKLKKFDLPCQIITLTREPISRAVSFAFEDWRKKVSPQLHASEIDSDVMSDVVEKMLTDDNGHSDPSHWFRQELQTVFGVDLFSQPYDFENGFSIIDDNRYKTLIIRLEDLDRSLSDGLSAFFKKELDIPHLKKSNIGKDKWYSDTLYSVKNSFKISEPLAKKIFSTQYFNHFYMNDLSHIKERWVSQ